MVSGCGSTSWCRSAIGSGVRELTRVELMPDGKCRANFIGMPWQPKLDLYGLIVFDAFGARPYLVGSCLIRRDFRDVDVRVILPDDEFEVLFGEGMIATEHRANPKLSAINMAFSSLGKEMTDLPIDFQIDQMTRANTEHDGPRNALGIGMAKRWGIHA